jgi:cation:H+ antiporter
MLELLIVSLVLLVSLFLITKGTDFSTDSLVPVANWLGTSYIAVASIIVSIMLSVPEVFIAIHAFFQGHEGISLGVIIGSIVCNIGLMTGLSAMIKPLLVDKRVVIRDGVFAFIISLIVFIFGLDMSFDRQEGVVLLLLFVPYVLNVWFFEKWHSLKDREEELKEIKDELQVIGLRWFRMKPSVFAFFLGIGMLLVGSYFFSYMLIRVGELTGVSDVILGITIGAIGPSIPNIVSAVSGTIKDYKKIAITETFGADIFTLTVTLGLLAVLMPFGINAKWLFFDIPLMIFMTAAMMLFIFKGHIRGEHAVLQHEGAVLVLIYIGFMIINVIIG